jgi:type IV secretory pathway protease TraF
MKVIAIASALAAIIATAAVAEPLPLQRPSVAGSCPHGWLASGSYCVPSQGAQDAVAKPPNGVCPFGWTSSASFCLRSGSTR